MQHVGCCQVGPVDILLDLMVTCCLQVACDEVQTGTRMQLLVRDPAAGRQALEADLQVDIPA